jgi:hypothetical protein
MTSEALNVEFSSSKVDAWGRQRNFFGKPGRLESAAGGQEQPSIKANQRS